MTKLVNTLLYDLALVQVIYSRNIRNARLTVEHDGNVETDMCFEDGFYHSPKALATTLNGDKPGRVKFSYQPVTQKFIAHVKSKPTFTLYGDLPDILGCGAGSGDSSASHASSARLMFVRASSIVDLRKWFRIAYVYSSIAETAHRRRQDCTASTNNADNRKTRGDGDGPFRPRPVHSRAESRIRQRRNRDKGRHEPTSAIRTWECDGDTSLSTVQLRAIQMNYDDYYARQVGGAMPYVNGARVQRGHGFGSLFSGLLRTVAPLIRRGAVALG